MLKKYIINLKNYKILNKINSGAYGTVYSIEDKKTKLKYAAKVLNPPSETPENKTMINREICIMSNTKHPTIINFYGYSLTDFDGNSNVTLIMELSNKGSLADQL